jgi:hypothetical protein
MDFFADGRTADNSCILVCCLFAMAAHATTATTAIESLVIAKSQKCLTNL